MAGGKSFQLFRIAGIRIGVDLSWFIILFLAIFWLRTVIAESAAVSETTAFVLAVIGAMGFFGSLLAHELGHAFAARREKLAVEGIDLFLFGGVMRMRGDTRSPGAEFRVAAAGPAVTLLLVVLFAGLAFLATGAGDALDAALLTDDSGTGPIAALLGLLASANAILFIFNLVPAFPLDGGRIARAAIWKATGDKDKATRVAATLGQGFSFLLIGYGIYIALNGDTFDGIWLAVLGYLLGQSARVAIVQSQVAKRIGGVTVADLMDAEPVAIGADLPAAQAYEEFFLRYGPGYDAFPVVEADGRLVGTAHREPVRQAAEGGADLPVRRLISSDTAEGVQLRTSLEEMIGHERLRADGVVNVVDEHGRLRGTVTRDQVVRALQARLAI